MEHELENITFYAQNHIAPLALCHNPAPVSDKPPGAPASVKPVYFCNSTKFQWQPVYLDLCAPPSGVAHVNVGYRLPWAPPCHHIILTDRQEKLAGQ